MTLTARQKYDHREIDWRELKLIRVGHALWTLYKRDRAKKGYPDIEIEQSCEIVWALKRDLRAQLKQERSERWANRLVTRQ